MRDGNSVVLVQITVSALAVASRWRNFNPTVLSVHMELTIIQFNE